MTPMIAPSTSIASTRGRVSRHGMIAAIRRRVSRWIVERIAPDRDNVVAAGALPLVGIQRILVCRPNHRLGNTILLTPLLAELEQRFPGAEVDMLASGVAAPAICAGYSGIGEITLIDRRAVRRPWKTLMALRRLRAKRYDLVIDAAAGSSSGRFAAALARARFQLRTDAPPAESMPLHLASRPVSALRWALAMGEGDAYPHLDVRLTPAEKISGRAALARVLHPEHGAGAPVLLLFPNATGTKCFDTAWWQAFIRELTARRGRVQIVELVAADGASRLAHEFPTYFTSDLRKLAAFIDAAGTYISADCGVMHLAAATSATTMGLFTTTDPARYTPYGGGNRGFACEDGSPVSAAARVASHLDALDR